MFPTKDVDMKFDKKRIYEEDKKYKLEREETEDEEESSSSVRLKQVPLAVREDEKKSKGNGDKNGKSQIELMKKCALNFILCFHTWYGSFQYENW